MLHNDFKKSSRELGQLLQESNRPFEGIHGEGLLNYAKESPKKSEENSASRS